MGFRFEETQNGEYTNRKPLFKEMDAGESVTIVPLKVIKEGTASKDGRSWKWVLWNMQVNGQYCYGFAPATWMNEEFAKFINQEIVITRVLNKEKGRLQWQLKKPEGSGNSFQAHDKDLYDSEEDAYYSDKEAVEYLKSEGKFDDMSAYIHLWQSYGSTADRAKEVFNNRHNL